MLLFQSGDAVYDSDEMFTLGESGVCRSCNACKLANPPAWLLSEQRAHVSICQKYAALCKNIEEVRNRLSG